MKRMTFPGSTAILTLRLPPTHSMQAWDPERMTYRCVPYITPCIQRINSLYRHRCLSDVSQLIPERNRATTCPRIEQTGVNSDVRPLVHHHSQTPIPTTKIRRNSPYRMKLNQHPLTRRNPCIAQFQRVLSSMSLTRPVCTNTHDPSRMMQNQYRRHVIDSHTPRRRCAWSGCPEYRDAAFNRRVILGIDEILREAYDTGV